MNTQLLPDYTCRLDVPSHQWLTQEAGFTRKLKYQHVLEYFVFGGSIYIGLQQWAKALELLEIAVTYPVRDNSISKIMVEAYKKWTLVNLLLHGKAAALPSTTNSHAAKLYHTLAKPYETVVTLFESASASRVKAEVDIGHVVWQEDGNFGLMGQVLTAYQRFQIRNLAKIYTTISIPEITRKTFSAETGHRLSSDQATESLIYSMISDGSLNALVTRTSNSPAVLTFGLTNSSLTESDVEHQLADSMRRIRAMTAEIKSTDQRLMHTKEYLRWAQGQMKLAKAGDELDTSWNSGSMDLVEDEDLMAGNF